MTLAALGLLAGVISARTAGLGGLDTLGVDDRGAWAGLASNALAVPHDQQMVQGFPGPVVAKAHEPAICRLVWRKMLRQHAPGNTAPQDVEDCVHQLAHLPGPMPSGLGGRRQKWGEDFPFRVRQVARIAQVVSVMFCSGLGGPPRRLQGERIKPLDSLNDSVFKPLRERFETAS